MPAQSVEKWLTSGKHAKINGLCLRPLEHRQLKDTPLSISRGQAETFILTAENGCWWILKKLHRERGLDRGYLQAVRHCLPLHEGFRSGTQREILEASHHLPDPNRYHSPELATWLDGTILMPRVPGGDWAGLADDLRDGSLQLDRTQRVYLCRRLAELMALLETAQCSHRDLSSGNVFVDRSTWLVSLIDFDSLFHPSLPMPSTTTCGTAGYTPAFAWHHNNPIASATWCAGSDRFALCLLCVEFLVLGQGARLTAEGGMFSQDELCARSSPALNQILNDLGASFSGAVPLLEKALASNAPLDCPSPQDWLDLCDRLIGPEVKPPSLGDVEAVDATIFEQILQRCRPPAPLWPAPHLKKIPVPTLELPRSTAPAVSLPDDPWRK